ncbi:MAG: GAF domain-containing protein [Gemmatimonadales bacterium]|nr:GAF domain-containing protein [Gemmatimonadales bacterium]NIN10374.1 GAF domain-containing protein [Gemmatimonadales bacterium]NIN49166.1 GAF domain-containing protein [Gemmatimonadales bacterium]NIP06630.1 GAF domain-containing protein [Gemmatimonadales bacterium]NIQ99960.1 GAF domain-containing protein [Gemmatimonadales bacterium]
MPENRDLSRWVRLFVTLGGLTFFVFAALALVNRPELRGGGFTLHLLILGPAAALSRRVGIALPGRGFASFILGVVLIALLLRGWHFAVLVGTLGIPLGDILLRRVRMRESLTTAAHVSLATGIVGLLYGTLGGATGAASVTVANLLPLALVVVVLPVLANVSFYSDLALTGLLPRVDMKLTLRWESVVSAAGAAFAIGWVELATAEVPPAAVVVLATTLLAVGWLVYWVIRTGVRADELALVQGLAGAVAAEVNIERSFERIKELTHLLVPWDNMGFARHDAARGEMELVADTSTAEKLRFDTESGLTGEAVRAGAPVVASALTRGITVLPEGESPGAEILIPLYHGTELVGSWSVRHSDPAMYRPADGELLNLLAPQLALSLALSSLVDPMADSSERTAAYVRQLTAASEKIEQAADVVADSAARAESEARSATDRVEQAVAALAELIESIEDTLHAASETQKANRTTAETATGVQEASARAVEQLGHLSSTIAEGAAEVSRLRDAAEDVEQFSDTIAQIANQTNLLALNATIEAARTGVHGKGFAVVADEVRKLAEQSAQAAQSMGRGAQETRRVIDRAARVLEELNSQLTELTRASEHWSGELSQVVATADVARTTGERMVMGPRHNLELAQEAKRILADARAAAADSAKEASDVAAASKEQVRAITELAGGASELVGLADQLARAAQFVSGDRSGEPSDRS